MKEVLRPTGPEDETITDYELVEGATSCWITVDNISVYVIRTDEGVVVDLYAYKCEMDGPLASCYGYNDEASEVIREVLCASR